MLFRELLRVRSCREYIQGNRNVYKRFDAALSSTIIHLSSSQEETHAAFQLLADSESSQLRSANEYPPITVYTYPRVPFDPPFPFRSKAPALVQAGESSTVDPYIRSATNLSYSRTLALLRRELGPHFDLEKLWERHTYYVRASLWKGPEVSQLEFTTGVR